MHINEVKVRTTFTIAIEKKDRVDIFSKYFESKTADVLYPKAFGKLTMDSLAHDVDKYFDNIQFVPGSGDASKWIAEYYGFDGYSCGAFLHNGVILMEVYKNGNHIKDIL